MGTLANFPSLNVIVSAAEATTVGAFNVSPTNNSDTLIEGTDYSYVDNVLTILSEKPITIANTDPNVATTTDTIVIKKDISANITLAGVNIDVSTKERITAFKIEDNSTGSNTITLQDNTINNLKSGAKCAGLQKNGNTGSLIINGSGTLNVTAGNNGGAGIGGDVHSSTSITINGGIINAGGDEGAAIGSGGNASGDSSININDGIIYAFDHDFNGGAGIGNGRSATGNCSINISGGYINATTHYNGDGIGNGVEATGTITFSTPVKENGDIADAWIEADSIADNDDTSDWNGIIFQNLEGQVYGNQIISEDNREILAHKSLVIKAGSSLEVCSILTNNGTLQISGGTLTSYDSRYLIGSGQFLTTDLSESMITVPTNLSYEGDEPITAIKQNTTVATKTYSGKEFTVTGWTQSVTPKDGSTTEYNVTYTPNDESYGEPITKVATLVLNEETPTTNPGITEVTGSPILTLPVTITSNTPDSTSATPNASFDITVAPAIEAQCDNDTKPNGPTLTTNTAIINFDGSVDSFEAGKSTKNATFDFTDLAYPSAGTYRYVITQSAAYINTTDNLVDGIADNVEKTFYLDVYVETDGADNQSIKYFVTKMVDGTKLDSFESQYNTFDFTVTNTVTGSAGDKEKDFTYTIVFDSTTIDGANILATKNGTDEDITLAGDNKTYTVLLKNGETVNFQNVPKDAKYTITRGSAEGYTTTISVAGDDTNGTINNDIFTFDETTNGITGNTQVTYTNNKDSILPTGINLVTMIPITISIVLFSSVIAIIAIKKKDKNC